MAGQRVRILVLGDVIGQPGCRALFVGLQSLIKNFKANGVIVNGENAFDGFGITPELADSLFSSGADVITTGNHVWQKKEILPYLDSEPRILRPANYPPDVPGHGTHVFETRGVRIGVLNLQGRERMSPLDCPFRKSRDILRKLKGDSDAIIVDFHAEAAEEKEALGVYLDGDVSLVAGTHTHIQTMDTKILPKGTGYITDLGMIGPSEGVIGFSKTVSVRRSITQMPLKGEVASGVAVIQGVVAEIDGDTGKTVSIERINRLSLV
ncbi:MAG: TIGR00282 family metallophosphoesterase [Spirochaetia bacterium]